MPVSRESLTYRDARGNTSTIRFFVNAATAADRTTKAQAVIDAILPLTNALLQRASGPVDYSTPLAYPAPAAGEGFTPIEDKLVLKGQCSNLQSWSIQLPAPIEAAFLADDETPDFTQAALAALIVVLQTAGAGGAVVSSLPGSPLALVYGGARIRRKAHRRFSLTTKNPQLTGPGL